MEIKEGRVLKVNAGCLSSLCACYGFFSLYSLVGFYCLLVCIAVYAGSTQLTSLAKFLTTCRIEAK